MYTYDISYLNQTNRSAYQADFDLLFKTEKLRIETVVNGTVLPIKNDEEFVARGGVLDENGVYQKLSGWYRDKEHTYPMAEGYGFDTAEYVDEDVIYCGVYIHQWGHFLLETTNRLWYWLSLSQDDRARYKLVFLCNYKQKPHGNMLEFLNLLGIKTEDIISIETPTRFRSIVIPEHSSRLGESYTKEFLIPFQEIVKHISPSSYKKIYLSRTKFCENANTIGEEKIEKFFAENGFKIIFPETLSLKEQISLMLGAEQVVMLNGSASHNTLFCKRETEVIILNRFAFINKAQFVCDYANSLRTIYIDSYQTFLPALHGRGPFLMSITDNLYQFAKDRKMKLSIRLGCNTRDVMNYIKMWHKMYSKQANFAILTPFYFQKMPQAFSTFLHVQQLRQEQSFLYKINPFNNIKQKDFSNEQEYSDLRVIKESNLFNKWWYLWHYHADVFKSKLSANCKLVLADSIKNFGTYEVGVKLHPAVTATLRVQVTES